MEKRYNGWKNYETWRIMLEFFDGFGETFDEELKFEDIYSLAEYLKSDIEEFIEESCDNMLVKGWANGFIENADFREIAERLAEDYPRLVK